MGESMTLLTLEEQKRRHVEYLREKNLDVQELETTEEFIRCKTIGQTQGRGECVYKSTINEMEGGKVGIVTWVRWSKAGQGTFKTYGIKERSPQVESEDDPVKKARAFFFKFCNTVGTSDYLDRKGVKAFGGIRFRVEEKFGNVAVVPAYDIQGNLIAYQTLNGDGTKRFPKGAEIKGLFFPLQPLEDRKIIGVAESYATAATIQEIADFPIVCAFSSDNLKDVGVALAKKHKEAYFVFFADNDRHLPDNKGMERARDACNAIGRRATLIAPGFDEALPSHDLSDWNDLARLRGKEAVRNQIFNFLQR